MIEVTLATGVDDVWAHLRDPALIRRWFGWEYDGLAEEIDHIFVRQAKVDDDARTIEWEYGPEHEDRFALLPEGDQTILRVTRSGPADAEEDSPYDDIAEGWISFVEQLRFALARHPGQERGTLYLSAPVASAATLPVAATLGLGEAAEAPVGGRYAAVAGPGMALGGQVWFRTGHQLGLTVEQLGDGLLLVTEKPAPVKPPHGAASLTLSVYGSDTARLEDLTAGWEDWWQRNVAAEADPKSA